MNYRIVLKLIDNATYSMLMTFTISAFEKMSNFIFETGDFLRMVCSEFESAVFQICIALFKIQLILISIGE